MVSVTRKISHVDKVLEFHSRIQKHYLLYTVSFYIFSHEFWDHLKLAKHKNLFLCVSMIFFSAFVTFLCIKLHITNQVIPSNLDLIYWIFFVNSASNFFSLSCLHRIFFKRHFLMYDTPYLLLNVMPTIRLICY